jgi:hypothetical protein
MKVKLAEGRALRDPTTRAMMKPDEVRDVPDNSIYWRRRLRDGDVVAADAPAPAAHRGHHAAAEKKE